LAAQNGNHPDFASLDLIDPEQAREVDLAELPPTVRSESQGNEEVFPGLTPALRLRVAYDKDREKLILRGLVVSPVVGLDSAFLKALSQRECEGLLRLDGDVEEPCDPGGQVE
jgi:hypothetical protein